MPAGEATSGGWVRPGTGRQPGRPFGRFGVVRSGAMVPDLHGFIASLHADPVPYGALYARLEQAVANRDVPLLSALVAALDRASSAGVAAAPHLASMAENALALVPGIAAVDAVFGMSAVAAARPAGRSVPGHSDAWARETGERLACVQGEESLLHAIARFGGERVHHDLLAIWIHTAVIRGGSLEQLEPVVRYHEVLRASGHPLAKLPLSLLPIERATPPEQPRFAVTSWGGWGGWPQIGSLDLAPPEGTERRVGRERTSEERAAAIGEVTASWRAVSNGIYEARVFELDPALPGVPASPRLLLDLGLECLAGAEPGAVRASVLSPERAWDVLFAAGAHGGDYDVARSGAWGRFAAWTSLRALAGLDPDATYAETEDAARACAWTGFLADTDWFYRVVTDLGIAAVAPSGRSIAVLAGSDTG